jgi:hypothetical protein
MSPFLNKLCKLIFIIEIRLEMNDVYFQNAVETEHSIQEVLRTHFLLKCVRCEGRKVGLVVGRRRRQRSSLDSHFRCMVSV